MKTHHPPANDAERLANLIEGLASLDDDDEPSDDEIRAQAEASGVDFAAWAARIHTAIEARDDELRGQARRRRATRALVAGLLAAKRREGSEPDLPGPAGLRATHR